MLGYTQEMLVTANEARIEARDAGTTTIRRTQLTSEFSYSPEVPSGKLRIRARLVTEEVCTEQQCGLKSKRDGRYVMSGMKH